MYAHRDDGQSVLELALVLPLFVVLTLIAIDFGRAMQGYVAVANAAREAVSYISMHPTDVAGAINAATAEAGSLTVTVNVVPASGPGSVAHADATLLFQPYTGGVLGLGAAIPVRGAASMVQQ